MELKLQVHAAVVTLIILCWLWYAKASTQEDTLAGPGLNVCVKKRALVRHVITTKSFAEPVYKPYLRPCNHWSTRLCSSYKTFYKRSFREVKLTQFDVATYYTCCPGWRREKGSNQCNVAVCTKGCRNNGACTKPDSCTCRHGWTGSDCSEDINECANENGGCSQICINNHGSYKCSCKDGYIAKGKRCEVCLQCSREWKIMEERMRWLEKEVSTLRNRLMSYEGIQLLSEKQDLRGPPGMKGERGDTGPQVPPGPPAEVLGSVIGRLAHFELFIKQCQCVKKLKENEEERKDTEHAVATHTG